MKNIHKPEPGQKTPSLRDGVHRWIAENPYLAFLLDALSGLSLVCFAEEVSATWDARLHLPFFHFREGSGHAVQYHPEAYWEFRLHPLHFSTISWQIPPLNEQPLAVIKGHSTPCFTVEQINGTTSFHLFVI